LVPSNRERRASESRTDARSPVDQIEEALGALVRLTRAPRFAEVVRGRANVELDRGDYAALNRIAELKGARLSDVANHLGLDVSTVSRQVQHLEQRGFIERSPDPGDGRAIRLELSDAGDDITNRMRDAWRETVGEVVEAWSQADISRFGALIDRFVTDLVHYLE
jgi:DNA-binding MarR family transcriptional regulator